MTTELPLTKTQDLSRVTLHALLHRIHTTGSNTAYGEYSEERLFKKLPTKHIYASAKAIADNQPIPVGLKFCDVPAIYVAKWPDVMQAYQQDPTSMPYQRLIYG